MREQLLGRGIMTGMPRSPRVKHGGIVHHVANRAAKRFLTCSVEKLPVSSGALVREVLHNEE